MDPECDRYNFWPRRAIRAVAAQIIGGLLIVIRNTAVDLPVVQLYPYVESLCKI
eukprot:SAG31_NODE_1604_length_7767_cov_4.103808_3_plen_54_part_00